MMLCTSTMLSRVRPRSVSALSARAGSGRDGANWLSASARLSACNMIVRSSASTVCATVSNRKSASMPA